MTDGAIAIECVCHYFALRKLGFADKELHFRVADDGAAVVDIRRGRSSCAVAIAHITSGQDFLTELTRALDLYSKDQLFDFGFVYHHSNVYAQHGKLLDFLVLYNDFVLVPNFTIRAEAPGSTGGAGA